MTYDNDTKNYTKCGPCPVCGKYIKQKRFRGLSRCEECKRKSYIERSAANIERYKRKNGVIKVKGTLTNCIDCGIEIQRNSITHLRCKQCKHKNTNFLQRKYSKERRINDPLYAAKVRYKNFVSKSMTIMGFSKKSKTQQILGCSWNEFVIHIEKQFIDGMSWDKIKEIHIDHIIPLASAKTEEDVIRLNHFTNLRPLWAKDNLAKGAKMEHLI